MEVNNMETTEQRSERMKKFWADRKEEKKVEVIADSEGQPVAIAETVEKKETTAPWRPAKRLAIPEGLKDPRFVYRFVNTKKEGNEIKKLDEGWEYDTELSNKLKQRGLAALRSLEDGTPLDSHYRIRELIVMRMRRVVAAQRNKYYMDKGIVTRESMTKTMRKNMPEESQEAGVYADSFGLKGFNEEEREEIYRR